MYLPTAIAFERFEPCAGAAILSFLTRRSSSSFCAKSDLFAMLAAATLFQYYCLNNPRATNLLHCVFRVVNSSAYRGGEIEMGGNALLSLKLWLR